MRLHIVHRTEYRYSSPVSENFNEVRLQPVSDASQECHGFALTTVPYSPIRRYHDLNLNLVDHFYLADPHSELIVESRSTVTTSADASARAAKAGFPMQQLDECRRMERCYDFLQASEFVSLDVGVWRLGRDAVEGIDDAWQAAMAMMRLVHQSFVYDPTATTVATRTHEALEQRRGVCQDFAHVFIGMCRSMKIPARYVSGYLYAGDFSELRGDLATHAWAEVFIPDAGWLPLDPTNNRVADEHHVKVAVGRDYADAAPLRGNFKGRASQHMSVRLRITREDAGPAPQV